MITAYFFACLCVFGLAIGQILFKLSATAVTQAGTFFAIKPLLTISAALFLYGLTSVIWIWILQKIELGRVYPIMALAFILVPLGSYFVFGEKFSLQYFLGVAFISVGIVISVRA